MKKSLLLTLTLIALLLFGGRGLAQTKDSALLSRDNARVAADSAGLRRDSAELTDTTKAGAGAAFKDDDGFDPGIFFFLLIFAGIMVGAAIVGSMAAALLLLALFVMASAGILSMGVLVGLYRRSLTAGFRTVLYITCALGGAILGVVVFYLINHFLHLHYSYKTIGLAGAAGGMLGGLLLGLIVFALIRGLLKMLKQNVQATRLGEN